MRFYEELVVDIPDYPKPGVVFKDLTPLFADGRAFAAVVDDLAENFGRGCGPISRRGIRASPQAGKAAPGRDGTVLRLGVRHLFFGDACRCPDAG